MKSPQQTQFNEILELLSENLSITKTQHEAAVQSYKAVGKFLSNENSSLHEYEPYIKPQGSFIIGTTIQSVEEEGDIDLDVVCELKSKKANWTQFDVKQAVGDRLKENDVYKDMLDEEGRRCWTLEYRRNSDSANQRYHMDILPAIIANGYTIKLNEAMTAETYHDFDKLKLSITDKELDNYNTDTVPENWLQSNPYGYAIWFMNIAKTVNGVKRRMFSLNEAVKPVPEYQEDRLPLQRVVQLLKRHRDIHFSNESDEETSKQRPISCIITTLAARSYRGEEDLIDALYGVIKRMKSEIKFKYVKEYGKEVEWISNPVNPTENFADRWNDEGSLRRENFYNWLEQVQIDLSDAQSRIGLQNISESLSNAFGKKPVTKTFSDLGNRMRLLTESSGNNIDRKSGLVGAAITGLGNINPVKEHKFYGDEEDK